MKMLTEALSTGTKARAGGRRDSEGCGDDDALVTSITVLPAPPPSATGSTVERPPASDLLSTFGSFRINPAQHTPRPAACPLPTDSGVPTALCAPACVASSLPPLAQPVSPVRLATSSRKPALTALDYTSFVCLSTISVAMLSVQLRALCSSLCLCSGCSFVFVGLLHQWWQSQTPGQAGKDRVQCERQLQVMVTAALPRAVGTTQVEERKWAKSLATCTSAHNCSRPEKRKRSYVVLPSPLPLPPSLTHA